MEIQWRPVINELCKDKVISYLDELFSFFVLFSVSEFSTDVILIKHKQTKLSNVRNIWSHDLL